MSFSEIGKILLDLWNTSGFAGLTIYFMEGGWQHLVMIAISCVLLYLAIVKKFEPLLLCGIAFGCLLSNLPLAGLYSHSLWDAFMDPTAPFTTATARSSGKAACWTFSTSVSRPVCTPA